MKILKKPVGAGKTKELVDWLLVDREKRVLLTFYHEEAMRIKYAYRLTDNDRVMYWGDYVGRRKPGDLIAIDNLDTILERLIRGQISVVTITKYD